VIIGDAVDLINAVAPKVASQMDPGDFKKQCIRDSPSCWFPSAKVAAPRLPPPPTPTWDWPVSNSTSGCGDVDAVEVRPMPGSMFRHSGLLREEGGVAAVLARSRLQGRPWL